MTNIGKIIVLSGIASISQYCFAQKTSADLLKEGYRRYGVESGIIEYTVSGIQTGKETKYFDRWGLREASIKDLETKAGGMSIPSNTTSIFDGQITYNIDRKTNSATKVNNNLLTEISAKHETKDLTEIGEKTIKAMGAKKTGTEKYLGKQCALWEVKSLGSRLWVYNGVTLKSMTTMGGMNVNIIGRSFEEGVKIPEAKFSLPDGVTTKEAGDPMELLKQMKKKMKGS